MKRGIEAFGILVSALSLILMGRLVAWLVPHHKITVREMIGSQDRLPGLTRALYEHFEICALALLVAGITLAGVGALLLWRRRSVYDIYAPAATAVSTTLLFLYSGGAILALVMPFIQIIVGVEE
jgi:hypothetical protein